jgi:hypothetical protein
MVPNNYDAAGSEYYYAGALLVLAGRFRRRVVGYFNGNIPPGTRVGREIRLVKLPELSWVFGYLLRDERHGVVLYVPDAALLPGVEGFHPTRSGREIRQSQLFTSKIPPHHGSTSQIALLICDDSLSAMSNRLTTDDIDTDVGS